MGTDSENNFSFLEVNINRAVRIWSAWLWRWLLLGWGPPILIVAVPVYWEQRVFALLGQGLLRTLVVYIFGTVIFLAPLWVYFWAFHLIFDKDLGTFRIRLEKSHTTKSPSGGLEFLVPTRQRTQKIWNSWAGRSILWGFATVVASILVAATLLGLGFDEAAAFMGYLCWIWGFFAWLAASLFVLKPTLVKDFGDFRIRLVRTTTS